MIPANTNPLKGVRDALLNICADQLVYVLKVSEEKRTINVKK
jgi:hypothetical protein